MSEFRVIHVRILIHFVRVEFLNCLVDSYPSDEVYGRLLFDFLNLGEIEMPGASEV